MSTIGDNLGQGGRPALGVGFSVAPEQQVQLEYLTYPEFHEGIDLSEAPEEIKDGAAVDALDMELSNADRLIRSPGIVEISDSAPRSLLYMFEQSSVDYETELVAIDPPYLGYTGTGVFTWVDLTLAATQSFGWNALSYLGYLLFSNGADASYSRASNAAVVTNQTANVIAKTMATAFGRKFAGHYTSGGSTFANGIKWDDTTATIGGWTGAGSGSELLIPDTGSADYIVALRPLGYDLLAVLLRKSLWLGHRSGVSNHPANFRFRKGGVGCVHERTVAIGPDGVIFLSDDGVVNFTANSADIISGQINAELIPLDYGSLGSYTGVYQALGRRYYLMTPDVLWIYEFPIAEINRPGRWYKRSAQVDNMVSFTDQAGLITWDQLIGDWSAQTQPWNQIGRPSFGAPAPVYFGRAGLLGKEDATLFANFGTSLQPRWRTQQLNKGQTSDQIVTHGFEIEYAADASAVVVFKTMDKDEAFTNSITRTLPSTSGAVRRRTFWGISTGVGVQVQMEVTSGSPRIARVRQIVERVGPSLLATIVG